MEEIKYRYRFMARIVVEAETPLVIGSGEKNMITDAAVVLDVNNLPYIPGTSLAGIVRHAIGESIDLTFFGKHDPEVSMNDKGSEIIFSEARMVGKDGRIIDGLYAVDFSDTNFYAHFQELPVRQHVRITHKGVANDRGKFDEQVVFKGTRFCFEIEMLAEKEDLKNFNKVLETLKTDSLRIGGGSRSGFGEMAIVSIHTACLDLKKKEDLTAYLEKTSDLTAGADWKSWKNADVQPIRDENYVEYKLHLVPDDFYLFGSGIGDDKADMTPVKVRYVAWDHLTAEIKSEKVLIPGSSVKGALAHRVAYHYNKMMKQFADKVDDLSGIVGKNNEAVRELFGYEGEKQKGRTVGQVPGNVLISDFIVKKKVEDKLLNHVAINRYTGGAIPGALFTEKVVRDDNSKDGYVIRLLVRKRRYSDHVIDAFEAALRDICEGMLPLGGGVNRGNGCFTGWFEKNNAV